MEDIQTNYGFKLKYNKAWRSREQALMAVRGIMGESYGKLPSYLFMLAKNNPGCSIRGFRYCCPILCVNANFLKHKIGCQLLIALDANEQLFPVAFGVVDSENNNSWTYFMQQLRVAIGLVPDLVFVSDRHPSIANTLSTFLREQAEKVRFYNVNPLNKFEFHVNDGEHDFQVDLQTRTCTCRVFDLSGLPYKHALATARSRKTIPYEYCSRFFTTEAWCMEYVDTCYSVCNEGSWDIPENIKKRVCLKPPVKVKKGRITTKRRRSQCEPRKEQRRCNSCGGRGHNRATCKTMMPAPSTSRQQVSQPSQPSHDYST
ncbi:uncharacterized protein LOC124910759 [Impatiens glandulifera]|uniref:uncharacterized protein LOC124910759 n=1 Tax=Impatiens glandulifera TaxID=253017 RepID=UPI001FB161AB|nr:uncharacterized protein LOC124910759 [Impatiens glandulifera]